MRLSASQNTYVLRCTCGPANLVFSGEGVEIRGQVTCRSCGQERSWQDLQSDCGGSRPGGAEIHRLRPAS